MPLFDALVLIIGISLIVGYFVHKKSYSEGVADGTDATLGILESEGLIEIDDEGAVSAPRKTQRATRKSRS